MKTKKILVIEDEISLRKAIKFKLGILNYEVIEATNGHEGLDALEQDPDLIWLDLYMPMADGVFFLKEIKKSKKYNKIPILVVTVSQGKTQDARAIHGLNIVDFVVKSDLDLKEIISVVNSCIKKS